MKKTIKQFFLSKKSRVIENKFLEKYSDKHSLTLDVGAKDRGNSIYFPNLKTVNREHYDEVDYVGDMEDIGSIIADSSFDKVLCLSVLEHTVNPGKVISEIKRILKPGGMAIVSVPFIMTLHDTPTDYWRFTKYGLKYLFRDFEEVEIIENLNSMQTLGYMYHRLFLQTKVLKFRPLAIIFWFISKIHYLFYWLVTDEYGYVNFSRRETSILSNNILGVFKKI